MCVRRAPLRKFTRRLVRQPTNEVYRGCTRVTANRNEPAQPPSHSMWRRKGESDTLSCVVLRTCRVSVTDLRDVEHSVDVTAETLYEAVATALAALQQDNWVGEIGQGLTAVSVVVQQPPVTHEVKMKDFLSWLGRQGGLRQRSSSGKSWEKCFGRGIKHGSESLGVYSHALIVYSFHFSPSCQPAHKTERASNQQTNPCFRSRCERVHQGQLRGPTNGSIPPASRT